MASSLFLHKWNKDEISLLSLDKITMKRLNFICETAPPIACCSYCSSTAPPFSFLQYRYYTTIKVLIQFQLKNSSPVAFYAYCLSAEPPFYSYNKFSSYQLKRRLNPTAQSTSHVVIYSYMYDARGLAFLTLNLLSLVTNSSANSNNRRVIF